MELEKQHSPDATQITAVKTYTASLFIDNSLLIVEANWHWDLQTTEIFISDVMLDADLTFQGTRGIFFPDDLPAVKQAIAALKENETCSLSFRIITTYGEVKTVSADNARISNADEDAAADSGYSMLLKAYYRLQIEKGHEIATQLRIMLDQFERINNSGSWFVNVATGETFYSDQMFRLHGLMPGSLNTHPQTFIPFIHYEDKEVVEETLDKSFAEKFPLYLEFRIINTSGEIREVSLITEWIHNPKGEMVLIGILKDVTVSNEQLISLSQTRDDLSFHKQILQLHEKTSGSGYWFMNLLTRQSYFSDNYYRIHGIKPQSIPASIGMIVNYVHADDREKMQHALHKMRSLQIAPDLDYRIVRPDGRIRFISQKARLIVYGGDELVMTAVIRDITETRQNEKKLGTAEAQIHLKDFIHRQTEALAGIGSWTWDVENGDVDCSEQMCRILGYKKKMEFDLKQIIRAVHPDDRKKFTDEINTTIENNFETEFTCRLVTFGEVKNVKSFFKMLDFDGRKIMMGTLQDISLEFNMQTQLHESLQVSRLLTANIFDAVFITDTNNNIILWNKASEDLFEVQEEEVIRKNFFDAFPLQRNDERISEFNFALNGQKIHKPEVTIVPKKLHNISLIPLRDQENMVIGILHVIHDATTEVNMRNTLNERLGFIEKVLEQTIDRIIVLDKNLIYRYWNRTAEQQFRINSEYVTGKNILEVFPNIIDQPVYHELKKVLKGETVYMPAGKDPDTERYEESYLVPLTDENRNVTGILWIVHDLTNEVKFEQSAKEAEIKLREMIQHLSMQNKIYNYAEQIASLGTWTWNPETNKAVYSDNMFRLFGLDPQSVEPGFDNIPNYIHPDDRNKLMEIADDLKQLKQPTGTEYRVIRKDGKERIFRNRVEIITSSVEKLIIGTTQDITAQKLTEERLRNQHTRLNEAQQLSHIGSFEKDIATGKVDWSDEMFRIHGLEPQSKIMTTQEAMQYVYPDDVAMTEKKFFEAKTKTGTVSFTHRIIRADGALRIVNRTINSVANEEGKITMISGTLHDITETYENQIAREAAEILVNKKDEFMSIASHELKTPITNLKASIQLLGRSVEKEPEIKNFEGFISMASRQVNKLHELVNDLMDVTAIQAGTMRIRREKFNLADAVNDCITDLHDTIKSAAINIDSDLDVLIYGDQERIEQVIANILTNAVKYSKDDKTVTITARHVKGMIQILIADNGIGIPPEKQARIFDRYFRVEENLSRVTGLGLGLFISREIIRMHGGEIGVISDGKKGSTFWFTLPIK